MIEFKMINGEIVKRQISTFAKTELEVTPITANTDRAIRCTYSREFDKRQQKKLDAAALKDKLIEISAGAVLIPALFLTPAFVEMLINMIIG